MNHLVIGAGPAGLYFAICRKLFSPSHDVTVLEQNSGARTFGWGVVLSARTITNLRSVDSRLVDLILARASCWDKLTILRNGSAVSIGGHRFHGIARPELLKILREHAERLGAKIIDDARVDDLAVADEYDVVLGADGINSLIRRYVLDGAEPTVESGSNRYIWLGTTHRFEHFQFIIENCDAGLLWAHAYPHGDGGSTFIVECTSQTWERLNRVTDDPAQAVRMCEQVFRHHLGGHSLLPVTAHRPSAWLRFQQMSCRTWFRNKFVLAGDAAHTAHFSVASGTKLAFEDAEALARALPGADNRYLHLAFSNYRHQRAPVSARLQRAGHHSAAWFERLDRYMRLDDVTFAYALLTRSRQLSDDDLRRRDPAFMRSVERALHERHGMTLTGANAALSAGADDAVFMHRATNNLPSLIADEANHVR
jgi:anthraniloyl-CoA monooxygenase